VSVPNNLGTLMRQVPYTLHHIMTTAQLKTYRKNLRTWFDRASKEEVLSGMTWYNEAQRYAQFLATEHDTTPEIAAAVISALSPNNKWERNKLDASIVFAAVETSTPVESIKVCTYDANKRKAYNIASGKLVIDKSSPKTYAFAQNVGNLSSDFVTIDKWHLRACRTSSVSPRKVSTTCTAKQYRLIEEETVKVAKEYGLKGYEFQAIIWVTIRNSWMNN